jgi:adenine-specific DNA-methyltransferase
MFQMDQADLDFGIYRIMNAKRGEIEKFLDNELLPQVTSEFVKYRGTEIEEKKKELIQLDATLRDSGMNPDEAPKVKTLREEIAKYGDDKALTNEVFSHLSTFFRRYYDGGDFLSLRRYKKNTYAIPYEGEEVKLHWANADQYYIKTSEYLKDYSFKLPGTDKKAHFKLVDASQEKDNIKTETGKERKFRLHEEPILVEGKEVFIQFVYLPEKEKQDNLNKNTIETLTAEFGKKLKDFAEIFAPAPTAKNPKRTFLEKHLYSYTARFNFDFFIHKDLGGFLRLELDFYIKNEVLFVDDLDAQDERSLKSAVAKIKVIKHIAQKIITFLASLEDFQKKLWLKKKFVVACGYCVTLDRVPEALYAEIVKNEPQREEWVKLFAIDEIQGDLAKPAYSKPLTVEFLKANPYLVLDTKHYDEEFREKLLASFDNFDEDTDGLIINSENFQVLNLLLEKYKEQVQCIYIDPPYNTDASEIIYKNDYKNSSWLTLLDGRLRKGKLFLRGEGILCCTIDDYEHKNLGQLIEQIFDATVGTVAVRIKPSGRPIPNGFAVSHEYALFARRNSSTSISRLKRDDEQLARYREADDKGQFFWEMLRKAGSNSTNLDRPTMYFPLYIDSQNNIHLPDMIYNSTKQVYENIEPLKSGEFAVWPTKDNGKPGCWYFGYDQMSTIAKELTATKQSNGVYYLYYRRRPNEGVQPTTFWIDAKYSATEHGTALLKKLFQQHDAFSYPKSIFAVEDCLKVSGAYKPMSIILDFFAGSGTTAHAVINLNRQDMGKRKYILVEMGEYFDTVLKPRIQKVVYSKDWKDGKPVSREGISHMFKYLRLEGYDDTMDNLVAHRTDGQQIALKKMSAQAREEYMLSYQLDIETKASDSILNIDRFSDPFKYTLKIRKDNELKDQNIDLVETFNYLIGLYVKQTETIRGFKVVRGKLRTGEKTLVIWRNTKDKSNEDLDEFFKKQKYNTLDFEFDLIFVNGDNNLENLKVAEDKWKVRLIEEEFKKRMFEQAEI